MNVAGSIANWITNSNTERRARGHTNLRPLVRVCVRVRIRFDQSELSSELFYALTVSLYFSRTSTSTSTSMLFSLCCATAASTKLPLEMGLSVSRQCSFGKALQSARNARRLCVALLAAPAPLNLKSACFYYELVVFFPTIRLSNEYLLASLCAGR